MCDESVQPWLYWMSGLMSSTGVCQTVNRYQTKCGRGDELVRLYTGMLVVEVSMGRQAAGLWEYV